MKTSREKFLDQLADAAFEKYVNAVKSLAPGAEVVDISWFDDLADSEWEDYIIDTDWTIFRLKEAIKRGESSVSIRNIGGIYTNKIPVVSVDISEESSAFTEKFEAEKFFSNRFAF